MSKSRMSQQLLSAALSTALLAFAAPAAFAQDGTGNSDRSERSSRSSRSAERSERRGSRQSQKVEARFPDSSRDEPGISASQRLVKDLNALSEAANAGDAAKGAGMTLGRITGPDRSAAAVHVRDIAITAARRKGYSLPQIAKALNRHHTTILAAIRREKKRRGEA